MSFKIVAQMESREVLDAIISTYEQYAAKGEGYGKNRVLVIQPKKASKHGGLIKISSLKDEIDGESSLEESI